MIECQICKRQLGTLVGKHLKSHGISSAEYQAQYPGCPVIMPRTRSEESREKQAAKMRGRKHTEQTKTKIGAKHKGKKRSAQEIEKWQTSYQQFLEKNGGSPQKGYKRSEEFKQRMSEVAQNRDPELVRQKTEQMQAARRGQKMTEEQKSRYREARTKFMIENPDKLGPKKLFNTKPELQFEKILIDSGLVYRKAFQCGGFLYDFLINTDTIIEIDGPYHYSLNLYGSKSDPLELKEAGLKKTQDKDALKDRTAIEHGYKIYRIKVGSNLPLDWKDQVLGQGCNLFP